ncbi:MAG: hypothetical protein AAGE89_17220 [Pseudomonadota bacterium]
MKHDESSIAYSLFSLRLTVFMLMIVWAALKLADPSRYSGIFQSFYGIDFGATLVLILGAAQILFLLAFLAGAFKRVTYGGVLLMNLASMVVSFPRMMDNQLFVAAIPVFGASLALYLMREYDSLFVVGRKPALA